MFAPSRTSDASSIHVGTMSFGKMEGDAYEMHCIHASRRCTAYKLSDDEEDKLHHRQELEVIDSDYTNHLRGDEGHALAGIF